MAVEQEREEKKIGGDFVGGDKVAGDKIEVGEISGGAAALGRGARAEYHHHENTYMLPGKEPPLFVGVPDFPRYGLVGRDELLAEMIGRLRAGGAVSLSASGKGGVGKTALATAAAYHTDLLEHFSDGVLWA